MSTLDPLRWLAASPELDRVLELPPDQRAHYLESLRGRDATLAADVASLLDEHRELVAAGLLTDAPGGVSGRSMEATQSCSSVDSTGAESSGPTGPTRLGPYRIVRTLGRGGMGTVYEVDEIETGRRVALKILNERLNDARERERFNREGRLAASINHPHCVFVFAAVETDGRLAIAMELMQGTLADRLTREGPVPAPEAVDIVLELLSGLQAAAAIGILHRDVKPSNCFVGPDGGVKIGDFGISLSIRPTDDTTLFTRTRLAGTPAYASPEQLRGAALDVRSDIYSLGATLYELLTRRRPIAGRDLMSLLMSVANDMPQPPHALMPSVPKGLSQVVLRCLAKQPGQRFVDYDALAAALAPYSSTAATAATLGRRFFAGFVDRCVLAVLTTLVSILWLDDFVRERGVSFLLLRQVNSFLVLVSYFGIAESVWAATPGKALAGLRVVDSNDLPPRPWRALARAVMFSGIWTMLETLWLASSTSFVGVGFSWSALFLTQFPLLLPLAVFSTARRRNGYAGWHDLATGTRVVERRALARSSRAATPAESVKATPRAIARLGSFDVTEGAIAAMPAGWRPGYDDRLRRPVWIREAAPGMPPLDSWRMAMSRPTRLRWLAGRRESNDAWDVFEAVPGLPLEQACARPRGWEDVRWWLLDLARECAAQTSEARPPLRADRVWVLDTGGAKMVDDPTVDGLEPGSSGVQGSCASLLLDVVRAARGRYARHWPLGADQFVDWLRADPPRSASEIVGELEPLTRQRAVITRRWRALHVVGLAALPLASLVLTLVSAARFATPAMPREAQVVSLLLTGLQLAEQGQSLPPEQREAIEVTLASRYRHVLTDPRLSTRDYLFMGVRARTQIERLLRLHPTESEIQRANEHPFVRFVANTTFPAPGMRMDRRAVVTSAIRSVETGLGMVALFAFASALLFRGGFMRLLGLELVTVDGRPASRLRVLARTAVAWAPLIVLVVPASQMLNLQVKYSALRFLAENRTSLLIASGLALSCLLAGAVAAILHPERGIQDRLAGTWIVPR